MWRVLIQVLIPSDRVQIQEFKPPNNLNQVSPVLINLLIPPSRTNPVMNIQLESKSKSTSLKVFCDNWRSGRQAGRQTWNAADSLESFSTKGFMFILYIHALYTIIRKCGTEQTARGFDFIFVQRKFVSAPYLNFCHNLNSHLKPKRVFFYSRYSEDEDWAQDRLDLYCRYNNTASHPHSDMIYDIYTLSWSAFMYHSQIQDDWEGRRL